MKGKIKKTMITIAVFIIVQFSYITIVKSDIIDNTKNISLIVVDKNGDGEFTSIQEAIDYAAQYSLIFVKKGEYPEVIKIKKTIQIIGEGKDITIINPISEENKYAVYVGAPGIKIKNIGITNGALGLYSQGIKISSKKTEIDNCNIFNTPVGIAIWTNENEIFNSVFYGCKDEGIALLGSINNPCSNNIISDCIFYDNCDGIELQYSYYNKILRCKFFNNTHTGIDAIASDNNENIISNCEIINNHVNGIYLSSSDNNKIIDCNIKYNFNGDIIMNKYSENNEIIHNENSEEKTEYISYIRSIILKLLSKINNFKNLKILSF